MQYYLSDLCGKSDLLFMVVGAQVSAPDILICLRAICDEMSKPVWTCDVCGVFEILICLRARCVRDVQVLRGPAMSAARLRF